MCQLYLNKTEKNLPFVVSVVISIKDVKKKYVILVINLFRPQLRTRLKRILLPMKLKASVIPKEARTRGSVRQSCKK